MKIPKLIKSRALILSFMAVMCLPFSLSAQTPSETPPPPSAPRTMKIPVVRETTLPNGLKVVLVEKKGLPLVTVSLIIRTGAGSESETLAGLANMTAALVTKGTGSSTATEISNQIEFLGGSIDSGANWDSTSVTIGVTKVGLGKSLSIMSDVVIRPAFPEKEIVLLKKQTLDGFNVSLKQPGALLSYVASRYSFDEHLTRGTANSISSVARDDLIKFHKKYYQPENAVLIFTGDVSQINAFGFAKLFFGDWKNNSRFARKPPNSTETLDSNSDEKTDVVRRLLVIDLPDSGQAAVAYAKKLSTGRAYCEPGGDCIPSRIYFPATVLNSVLGGGYSARLNQEIRLKRGLSYGAGSNFDWRTGEANFIARAQTKNESAAHVAELVKSEIEKLSSEEIAESEMTPRKAVVTGGFGIRMQTNDGMAERLRDLYLYGLNPEELNSYINSINIVSSDNIKEFASNHLKGGDLIIVGDAKLFMDDLQKRFTNMTIEVIKADSVDLNRGDIRKRGR